jgi:hypothetical protein
VGKSASPLVYGDCGQAAGLSADERRCGPNEHIGNRPVDGLDSAQGWGFGQRSGQANRGLDPDLVHKGLEGPLGLAFWGGFTVPVNAAPQRYHFVWAQEQAAFVIRLAFGAQGQNVHIQGAALGETLGQGKEMKTGFAGVQQR